MSVLKRFDCTVGFHLFWCLSSGDVQQVYNMAAAHVVNGSSGPRRTPLYIGFLLVVPRFWINIIAEDSLYTSSMALVVRLHPQLSSLAMKSRPHRYLTARILYTTKGTSSFQVERLLTCADIAKNPVPNVKRVRKISMC